MNLPRVLTIAGSDSSGGAGIQADLKTFAALGVHGLCVVTAVTAQNSRGVYSVHPLPPTIVEEQINAVTSDFTPEFAKTGMLATAENIKIVIRAILRLNLKTVVDPVMNSTTGHQLLERKAVSELQRLIGYSELVTPNIYEAEKLSGVKITSLARAERAATEIMKRFGASAVLIKGGHIKKGSGVTDILVYKGGVHRYTAHRIDGEFHGAGCAYSAAITAELAKGSSLRDAVANARKFMVATLSEAPRLGTGGLRLVHPTGHLLKRAALAWAMEEIWRTANSLVSKEGFSWLVPEVGINIAVVLPGARSLRETVGLSGRIVRSGGRAVLTGFPQIAGSEHVARATLTAHQIDHRIRAGLNIRFSPELLNAFKKWNVPVFSFRRSAEPSGRKTMEWGIRRALRQKTPLPLVVYDRGAVGKEPMIRLLGESPAQLEELVDRILKSRAYMREQ